MKIKKYTKDLLESKLIEEETGDEVESLDDELDIEDVDGTLDPDESISDIADDLTAAVEATSDGELTLSDAEAEKAAKEIKDAAEDIGADDVALDSDEFEVLGVDNPITRILDVALAGARTSKRRKDTFGHNVLISGLPGSGKTASIYDWAKSRNINIVEVDCKNDDLSAFIGGYTVKDPDDPDWTKQAFSKNLMELEKPNSVLFLDEYNRQVKQSIRGSLYSLINNHRIPGPGPTKTHTFQNMLFTIAAINPTTKSDKGATALNDAEKTRFVHKLKDMDSDPETTINFLNAYYTKRINELNPEDEYYKEDLEEYLRELDIGLFVMMHPNPEFKYNDKKDLIDLELNDRTMLNQRSFTELLNACSGDIERFKTLIRYSSDFLDSDIEMILTILNSYIPLSFEELCKRKGIDPTGIVKLEPTTTKSAETESSTEEPELEDDPDLAPRAGAGKVRAKYPYEIGAAVAAAVKGW